MRQDAKCKRHTILVKLELVLAKQIRKNNKTCSFCTLCMS